VSIDPRRMVTRHAARLGLGTLLVVLGLACVWSTVAWGQGLDSVPAGHPVDWLSAAVGGGGMTGIGVLVVGLVALAKRLGIGMPRVVIGGDGKGEQAGDDEATSPIRLTPAPCEHDSKYAELAGKVGRLSERVAVMEASQTRMESGQARVEASVEGVRSLAQQILLRQMGG